MMKSNSIVAPIAFAVVASMSIQSAAAASSAEKQFTVRFGTSYSKLNDPVLNENSNIEITSDVTWNISAAWRPLEHWGAEIMYIGNTDNDVDVVEIENTKGLPYANFEAQTSNAYINWYPSAKNSTLQPYLGVGVNYTKYGNANWGETAKEAAKNFENKIEDLRLTVSDTWGPTVQFGVDYSLSKNLLVNAAVTYTYTSPDWTSYGKGKDGSKFKAEERGVELDPWTINLGIGYSF